MNCESILPLEDSFLSFAAKRKQEAILNNSIFIFPLSEESDSVVSASLHDRLLVRTGGVVHQVVRVAGRPVFVGSDFLNGLITNSHMSTIS